MAIHIEPRARHNWEDEGERIALELDERSAALVVGNDPVAAARVALAIAHSQARRRRVAVADAVGELAPIEALLPDGAKHGLVDMFVYGVSLGRVATPVDRAGNLFVIPSGATPVESEELFASERWPQLVNGFRDAGALLLIVARAGTGASAELLPLLDGVVLVGDSEAPEGARVLAHTRLGRAATVRKPPTAHPRRTASPRAPFWVAIAATVLAMVSLGWWAVQASRNPPSATTRTSAGAVLAESRPNPADSSALAAPADSLAAAGAPGVRDGADADEPAAAASEPVPFAVAMAQFNNITGAISRIEQEAARGIPAVTYVPFYDTNLRRQVFLVIGGAFNDRSDATALLRSLRRERALGRGQGHVVNAPLALLVQSGLTDEQAASVLDDYRLKGLPVYALVQGDGSVNIYAGAFENAKAAEPLLNTFHENGEKPSVVHRAGRPRQ